VGVRVSPGAPSSLLKIFPKNPLKNASQPLRTGVALTAQENTEYIKMEVTFKSLETPQEGVAVVVLFEDKDLTPAAKVLDEKTEGFLHRALTASNFKGKKGQCLSLMAPHHTSFDRVIVLGLGPIDDCSEHSVTESGSALAVELLKMKCSKVTVLLEGIAIPSLKNHELACHLAAGLLLRSYRFTKYKTKLKDEDQYKIDTLTMLTDFPENADQLFRKSSSSIEGVFLVRNLMCEPPNVLTPKVMMEELMGLKKLGVKVEVLDTAEMQKLGMNALLAVAQGSSNPPYMVVMQWQGGDPKDAPIAFVGKGVTFDTGGISIKPASKMDEMKMDMGGAAVVAGLMMALAGRKAPVNAVGVVGLVENMPDGSAMRPGDIVTSLSGQTIEILNTDAEGRLVLADALWYTQNRFHPQLMVDLATLTGAVVVALGTKYAAAMGNQVAIDKMKQTGDTIGEHIWQLPIDERYDKDINSKFADIKNTGAHGAGAITAGHFLQRFTNKTPWVHLDIAGIAWSDEIHPLSGSYPSGFGVRLLDKFLAKHYEMSV
jgi:leucyl aminopeptidase